MQEDPQAAEQRRRMGLPAGMDPRNYDPRRAFADPAAREKMARAQAVARAQAAAASSVVVATIVTLVTAAFGFAAALAWNDALTQLLNPAIESSLSTLHLPAVWAVLVKAIIITLIAVVAVVILNRAARRVVKQSAINAADAESMI
ncbi:MAG TPA: DUF5654 family protein [Ktedonobacterales bacterium]